MSHRTVDYPLIIIGAGAAGLGASVKASSLGISHLVLEASHRIGGRGLTECLDNGVPVDLGCHWMHCASRNPFVGLADRLGFEYDQSKPAYEAFKNGSWPDSALTFARAAYLESVDKAVREAHRFGKRVSIWDCMSQDSPFNAWASYWLSLMHSNDPDQVSVSDLAEFDDTHQDWPLRQGYGALISACGADCPVKLNSPVREIHWHTSNVRIVLTDGELTTQKALLTVSTGVLGAGDIKFVPELPAWKLQAIQDLPPGNYNNLFFPLAPGTLSDAPAAVGYQDDETCAAINIRPFGDDFIFVAVAGRFAWWLEKQGEQVASQWLADILAKLFGSEVRKQIGRFRSSAWGFDPWIKGAYSSAVPGSIEPRRVLAKTVDQKLLFAGEATSERVFNTAHGAWISGQEKIQAMHNQN